MFDLPGNSTTTLTFSLSLVADRQVELRCGTQYRQIAAAELEELVAACNRIYYAPGLKHDEPEQLVALGQRLYAWLDGTEGWLRSRLGQGRQAIHFDLTQTIGQRQLDPGLEALALQVAHLPWELLHDGQDHLLAAGQVATPVRMVTKRSAMERSPENRPLQLLFMATAPEGVTELNYEQEEANILDATEKQPLLLVTEESGAVAELGNLVQSYGVGYFDVFNLTGHGVIYTAKDYGSWLDRMEPRPMLAENTPCFLTEDDLGQARFSTVADFAAAFGARFPQVILLSGCHTGQVADNGAVPSMAQQLVQAGAEVVLGWARPVFDNTGILAAQTLYQSLAVGDTVEIAINKTIAALFRRYVERYVESNGKEYSDWHLLRVYRSTREVAGLVTPLQTPKRSRLNRKSVVQEFLGSEPVANAAEFVGRRRTLQRSLKALQVTSDKMGVFLHGMGGLGKSSVCARLCDRILAQRPTWRRVVIYGVFDEAVLLRKLEEAYVDCEGVTEALNSKLKLAGRLKQFFELVENLGQPLLLVLDDLEQNIPPENVRNGSLALTTEVFDLLAALGRGLDGAASQVLITCRYDCPLPERLNLYAEQLARMERGDVRKQCQRLKLKPREALTERLVKIADGNPRLLKWLSEVVTAEDWAVTIDIADLLERLEAVETKFRQNLLLEILVAVLGADEQRDLARLSVVQVPMSADLVAALVPGLDLEKLAGLTLVEPSRGEAGELYRVPTVLGDVLKSQLDAVAWQSAQKVAAELLHRVWWDETDNRDTDQAMEILRLGLKAEAWEIAVSVGDTMASNRVNNARYLEAIDICTKILAVHEDYRIRHRLARAQKNIGEVEALVNYETALKSCPEEELLEKAAILNNLSNLLVQQGDIERALDLWNQSLEIKEKIGDVQGKATTLSNMAMVVEQQGDVDRALQFWQESLEIKETIGFVKDFVSGLKSNRHAPFKFNREAV
jgi:tetratricopeptide (TPR) repeat protein